jgi:predicted small integral membrane protein
MKTAMRQPVTNDHVLAVTAIAGLYVGTLAWDFLEGQDDKRKGLLRFAIERTELKDGAPLEKHFLRQKEIAWLTTRRFKPNYWGGLNSFSLG